MKTFFLFVAVEKKVPMATKPSPPPPRLSGTVGGTKKITFFTLTYPIFRRRGEVWLPPRRSLASNTHSHPLLNIKNFYFFCYLVAPFLAFDVLLLFLCSNNIPGRQLIFQRSEYFFFLRFKVHSLQPDTISFKNISRKF